MDVRANTREVTEGWPGVLWLETATGGEWRWKGA